jgi:hypothetical protein
VTLGPFPTAPVIARLVALVPALKAVSHAADLQAAIDGAATASIAPAAYVVIGERGERPAGASGGVLIQQVAVAVQVVSIVRNFARAATGADARAEMDALLAAERAALINWSPGAEFKAIWFQAGRDEIYKGGALITTHIYASGYRIQANRATT